MQILISRDYSNKYVVWEHEYEKAHGCPPNHELPEDLNVGDSFIANPQSVKADKVRERKAGGIIGWLRSWATRRGGRDKISYSVTKQRIPWGSGNGTNYKVEIDKKIYLVMRTK
jgi:hypothetical protein